MGPRRVRLALALVALAGAGCGGGGDDEAAAAAPNDGPGATVGAAGAGRRRRPARRLPATVELYFTSGEQFRKVERGSPPAGRRWRTRPRRSSPGRRRDELAQPRRGRRRRSRPGSRSRTSTSPATAPRPCASRGSSWPGSPPRQPQRTPAEQDELDARLGQVTYTLTQFPRVEKATVVAGGIGVEPALTRDDFAKPRDRPESEPRPRGAKSSETRAIQRRLARLRYLPKARWTASADTAPSRR